MNPHKLYMDLYYEAIAAQIESEEYETFVAMPFRDDKGYQSSEVYEGLICKAAQIANEELEDTSPRRFAKPVRVDKIAPNASEITEDIVEGILRCHFFIADFTLANHGVLVETGVALALKPSKNMVFLIQGKLDQVHFDLKDNRFIRYDKDGAVHGIATALLFGAKSFEESIGPSMIEVRKRLSPESMHLLNLYAQLRKVRPANSLHFGQVSRDKQFGKTQAERRLVFMNAIRELLDKHLIYLDYAVADDGINPDRFGLHATKFGIQFIRQTWPRQLGDLTFHRMTAISQREIKPISPK